MNTIPPIKENAMKQLDEKTMRVLEERIPELAVSAVKLAYHNALASGQSVLAAVNGQLIEKLPDGTIRVIKSLPSPIPVVPGQRLVRVR